MVSLDIKCPSSKMHENNHLENISLLRKNDQLNKKLNGYIFTMNHRFVNWRY